MTARGMDKLSVIATAVGVSEGAVSRWCSGAAITIEHAIRLCDVLDLSLDWLLLGRGPMDAHRLFQLAQAQTTTLGLIDAMPPDVRTCLDHFLAAVLSIHI